MSKKQPNLKSLKKRNMESNKGGKKKKFPEDDIQIVDTGGGP